MNEKTTQANFSPYSYLIGETKHPDTDKKVKTADKVSERIANVA